MDKDLKGRKIILEWLGNNLRRERKKKGYSQMGLSEKANVDFSFYGAVERGEKAITVQKLSQITDALKIPISDLFLNEPTNFSVSSQDIQKEKKIEKILSILQNRDLDDLTLVQNILSKIFSWQKNKK